MPVEPVEDCVPEDWVLELAELPNVPEVESGFEVLCCSLLGDDGVFCVSPDVDAFVEDWSDWYAPDPAADPEAEPEMPVLPDEALC